MCRVKQTRSLCLLPPPSPSQVGAGDEVDESRVGRVVDNAQVSKWVELIMNPIVTVANGRNCCRSGAPFQDWNEHEQFLPSWKFSDSPAIAVMHSASSSANFTAQVYFMRNVRCNGMQVCAACAWNWSSGGGKVCECNSSFRTDA